MLKEEVEALLKLEGLYLYMYPPKSPKGNWKAEIGWILPITNRKFHMCSGWGVTNHHAASKAYKSHVKYKNLINHANH